MKNEKLFTLLSAYYVLECKYRNYHWNVECHHFTEYHSFFEKSYDTIAEEIDEIAEQIRKLGEKVPATLQNFVKSAENASIDISNDAEKSNEMINDLIAYNKKVVEMVKDLKIELDGQREYMGTCNLMDDLLGSREKEVWFLTSLSK